MSGLSSCRNCSTMGIRARTELMFQDAILRLEDIWRLLAGALLPVDVKGVMSRCRGTSLAPQPNDAKAPAPGAWSGGHQAWFTRGQLRATVRATGGKPEAIAAQLQPCF